MDEKLTHLNDLLREQIALHQALERELLTEAEQDGRLDGATLLTLQRNKQKHLREIHALEQQRLALVDELAAAWGEAPAELTLRRIVPRAPEPLAETLAQCHRQLLELVNRIRELAEVTAGNAQARLKAIDATLSIISEAVKMHPTYSEEGRLHKKTPTFKETSA